MPYPRRFTAGSTIGVALPKGFIKAERMTLGLSAVADDFSGRLRPSSQIARGRVGQRGAQRGLLDDGYINPEIPLPPSTIRRPSNVLEVPRYW